MKPRFILLLMAAMGLLAASETAEKPSMRSILAGVIRKQVVYVPPAPTETVVTMLPAPGDELVVLEPFTVTTPADAFAHKIEEQRQKFLDEEFTLRKGGTIMKIEGKTVTMELKIRYDAGHQGWDLLSFSW